jgi:hypothetical protein
MKAAKSFFTVPREKLSGRPLAAETRQSRGCQRISNVSPIHLQALFFKTLTPRPN